MVKIDDAVYKKMFGARSPLSEEGVDKLLDSISTADVALIVVDLDTSDPSYEKLRSRNYHGRKIYWAQNAQLIEGDASESLRLGSDEPLFLPGGVLGKEECVDHLNGISLMEPDRDGVVRGYPQRINVLRRGHSDSTTAKVEEWDNLPWSVAKEVKGWQTMGRHEKVLFDFSFDPERYPSFSAEKMIQIVAKNPDTWKKLVDGKIVLLGGTFSAARDKYPTPAGYVDGVKLIGMAIDTAIADKDIKTLNHTLLFAADVVCGIIFILLAHFLSARRLILLAVVAPILMSFFSIVVFKNLSMWVSFVPVICGIYGHLLHNHIQEHQELRLKHAALTKEVQTLRASAKE